MHDFRKSILFYTREWVLRLLRMNWRKARRSTKVKMESSIPTKTKKPEDGLYGVTSDDDPVLFRTKYLWNKPFFSPWAMIRILKVPTPYKRTDLRPSLSLHLISPQHWSRTHRRTPYVCILYKIQFLNSFSVKIHKYIYIYMYIYIYAVWISKVIYM